MPDNEQYGNGQLNDQPSNQTPNTSLSEFNATDYLLTTEQQPYTNGFVSNYLGSLPNNNPSSPQLNVGSYGITNNDYFPSRNKIEAGYYGGSIVGNVGIYTQGETLFPIGVLEKRRDALNAAAMQYFERSLKPFDVQRKPLKNELLADKLDKVVLDKTKYFIEEARKLDPAYGLDMMMSGKAGQLSEEWRKFRSDINTWSSQFDYVQDAAVQTEAWAAQGFYITPEFKKIMYDVIQGADDIENGVMTGEGEKIVSNLKRYASIPQITKDIVQNMVLTQTVEYLDANGNSVKSNLSDAIDNAKKSNNTTLLSELTTKYLSDQQLDDIVGSYVTSLHGDLFYGNVTVNGTQVSIPKEDGRVYDYQSLYNSLRGMVGVQKSIQTTQIQEPKGTSVTVNNVEPKDVTPATSWLFNSFKTLYSDATGDASTIFVDAKNYASRTGTSIRFVIDGVEQYVPISERSTVVDYLGKIASRQPGDTGIGSTNMPAASVSINMLSNDMLTESLNFVSKNQERLAKKEFKVGTFTPFEPETKEGAVAITVGKSGTVNIDNEGSLYNLAGFAEANGESVYVPVVNGLKKTTVSITGVSKVGSDGFYLEGENGMRGILVPANIAQSSGGATNVQSEDASNISVGTELRWVEGAYYRDGGSDAKGSYIVYKLSDGKQYEENGAAITAPKSGVTSVYKGAMKNQVVEPYNKLKTGGTDQSGSTSVTFTQNVTGDKPVSATMSNTVYDATNYTNYLKIAASGKEYWKQNGIPEDEVKKGTELLDKVINMYQDALEPQNKRMYSELWSGFDGKVQDLAKEAYAEYASSGNWSKLYGTLYSILQPKMVAGRLSSYGQYVNYYSK